MRYDRICRTVKSLNIDYLNVYESLRGEDMYGLRVEKPKDDDTHPGVSGSLRIEKLVYEHLLEKIFNQ
jgi:hypothetical protein